MPQGYKFALTLDGSEVNFKRLDVHEEAISINVARRYLPDGSLNTGFNSEEGDLVMLVFTLEDLQDGGDSTNEVFLSYLAGQVYDDVDYLIEYDGIELYNGTGIYVRDGGTSGGIPGEAGFRFVFSSRNAFV